MKTHPIIFSAPMVRPIFEGRKTQTRRLIKNKKFSIFYSGYNDEFIKDSENNEWVERSIPRIRVNDLLWVRENWLTWKDLDGVPPRDLGRGVEIAYPATPYEATPMDGRIRPSIHMPSWASRITLRVTDVRIERVQEISDEDAIAEGIPNAPYAINPYISFKKLWEEINGESSWNDNPWVAAYTFESIFKNINEVRYAA